MFDIRSFSGKGMLCSAEPSPVDRSKLFILHLHPPPPPPPPPADLFMPLPTRFLCEEFNQVAISAQGHIFPPPSIVRYLFIQLSEPRRRGEKEHVQALKQYQRRFEPGPLIESMAFYRALSFRAPLYAMGIRLPDGTCLPKCHPSKRPLKCQCSINN